MASTPKRPIEKIRLEVVEINTYSNSIVLEGSSGDLKYILMIDADLDRDMVSDAVAGDKWDITLKNTIKFKKKPTTSSKKIIGVCPGSNRPYTPREYIYHGLCPECGKDIALNGTRAVGYSLRKHNA